MITEGSVKADREREELESAKSKGRSRKREEKILGKETGLVAERGDGYLVPFL